MNEIKLYLQTFVFENLSKKNQNKFLLNALERNIIKGFSRKKLRRVTLMCWMEGEGKEGEGIGGWDGNWMAKAGSTSPSLLHKNDFFFFKKNIYFHFIIFYNFLFFWGSSLLFSFSG